MTEKISEFRRRMADGSTLVLVPHKAESAVKDSEGQTITLTYATKAELQPVKVIADNAIRKDISASQTMTGALIVGGHDLSKAVTTNENDQSITGQFRIKCGTVSSEGTHLKVTLPIKAENVNNQNIYIQSILEDIDHLDMIRLRGRLWNTTRHDYYIDMRRTGDDAENNVVHFGFDPNGVQFLEIPTPTQYRANQVVNMAYLKYTGQNAIDVGQNLVHTDGIENISGRKNSAFVYNNFYEVDAFSTARAGWHCIYDIGNQARWIGELVLARVSNANFAYRASKSSFEVCIETSTSAFLKKNYVHGTTPNVKLCHDENGWHILVNCPSYIRTFTRLDTEVYTWSPGDYTFKVSENAGVVVAEPSAEQYDTIIDVTEW